MEDTGLFFWLIVFAVAVLQGVGKKKRKPGQMGRVPPGQQTRGVPRGGPGEPVEVDLESVRPDATRAPAAGGSGSGGPAGEGEKSSEGMIPADVWAEILGLARGQPTKQPSQGQTTEASAGEGYSGGPTMDEIEAGADPIRREPRRRADVPRPERSRTVRPEVEEADVLVQSRERMPARAPTSPSRAVPQSHTAQGKHHRQAPSDFESRLGITPEGPGTGSPVAPEGAGIRTARGKLFGTGSTEELRKAVILQEVLGPPVGLKGE